ncbi:MAG: cyclic lactone autoinducer peptide [Oscillospiraceae bacterium]
MTQTKKILTNACKMLMAFVLALGAFSAQSACVCWFHQPEVPETMKKFCKNNGGNK